MKAILGIAIVLALILGQVNEAWTATLSRQTVSDSAAALEPTYANADTASGDLVTNTDGKTLLLVKNPGSSTATVTVTAQVASTTKPGFGTVSRANIVATLSAGEAAVMGPFPIDAFNTGAGNISISYGSAGAPDVDTAALKLP